MTTREIENCPMCGPEATLYRWTSFYRNADAAGNDRTERAQVRCEECDARGPEVGAETPEAAARCAIGLWNERVRYCEIELKSLREQAAKALREQTEQTNQLRERIDNQARSLMARNAEIAELTERCQRAELERTTAQLDAQRQRHAASLQQSLKDSAQRQLTSTDRDLVEVRACLRQANDDIAKLREQLESSWEPMSVVAVAAVVGLIVGMLGHWYA